MRFKAKCECGTEFRAAKRKTFGTNGLKTLINAHITKEAAIAAASLHVGDNE